MYTIWVPKLDENKPKYRAVFDALKTDIEKGVLEDETKLPPVRELAYQLSITPATVARAYQMATEAGLCEARKGDGTYVKPARAEIKQLRELENLSIGEDGVYNLFGRSVPDVGQMHHANTIIANLAQQNQLAPHLYTSAENRVMLESALADWLKHDGIDVDGRDIISTQGAALAAQMAAHTMRKDQSRLSGLIEPISYTGFIEIEHCGLCHYHSVDIDEQGATPEGIALAAEKFDADFFITSAVAQNPFSHTMSEARMSEIAQVARQYDMQLIDDLVYRHGANKTQKTLRDFAPERVWSVTSMSKIGYPGLSIGVLIPPLDRVKQARQAVFDHCAGVRGINWRIGYEVLRSDQFFPLIEKQKREVAARQQIACEVLAGHDLQMAESAPFLWLKLPKQIALTRFQSRLEARRVKTAAADCFAVSGEFPNAVRLTLGGAHTREDFKAALEIVRDVLETEVFERVI